MVGLVEAHADSLILVGAHAVLLCATDFDVQRMPMGDGDLGITPGLVADLPSIETLLADAGCEHRTASCPGLWGREPFDGSDGTRLFREKMDLLARTACSERRAAASTASRR